MRRNLKFPVQGVTTLVTLCLVAMPLLWPAHAKPAAKSASLEAAEAYANNCASCHGPQGHGDGVITQPAIWSGIEGIDLRRKPRDYTKEWFRFGDSHAAIVRTITNGSPGTAMNGFKEIYSPAVIDELASIVLKFRGKLTNETIRHQFPERIPADAAH